FRLCDRYLHEYLDTNGFSEEEILNITFEACDAAGRGEVLASAVVQFLQAMTGHSGAQDKLIVLKHMLDPEDRDPPVDRDAFHTTMRKWIARCSQDGLFDDSYQASVPDSCKATTNGAEFSPSPTETTFTDQSEYHCNAGDLLAMVAELKHAQRRLRGQNSSLLRSVSQCEETNLQLMMDVSELRSKLASAQLCAGRARSVAEELDEARRALRESQERTSRAQANSHSLMKEIEHLKAHIKVMEEMNEKLLLERNSAEDRLNKLKRANTDVREELEELRVLLAMKERENTKKTITLQKLKETFLDYHRIIDGLQCDLARLQEHSQQALLRFDKCSSLKSPTVPNHYSLHREIQEAEPRTCVEENSSSVSELQSPSSPKRDLYNFIHKIKSAELQDAYTAESFQKELHQDQQEQTSSKQLLTILRELERPRSPWDQQPDRRQIETHRQTQEVRRAPPITWWKALRVENEKHTWNTRDLQDTTKDMQEKISALEIQLKEAQMEVQKSRKELREAHVWTKRADVAMQTEQVEDERKRVAAEKILESLRKVEVVVTRALQAAEMLTESERRMKERMEAISNKVEEALSRTADTEDQLRGLEDRVSCCTKGQQSKQGCPDFPLPRHFLQLFRRDPEAFPGQPRDIVSQACPGSSLGPLPGGACPEHLPREMSRRHPKQMPEPPQLSPFDVEEQRVYSELLPGDRAPYPISKGAPHHPMEEAHFGRLYPGSYPFDRDPELMTIDRHIDRITAAPALIHLSISRSILPSPVNKTPRYLNFSTRGRNSPPTWRVQATFFRLRTMASDLEVLTLIPAASDSAAKLTVHASTSHRMPRGTRSNAFSKSTNTCGLVRLPRTLEHPVEGIELVQCSTTRMKTALFLLYPRRRVSGIEKFLKVFFPPSDNIPSRGQQLSTSTVNSVARELLNPSEAPNGLPEFPRGRPIVLLHVLTEFLPDPSFCFRDHHGCSSLGLPVCLSCLQSPASQPGLIGLLQLDSIPYFQCPPLCSGIAATTGTRDLTATAPDGCVNNGGGEHGPLRLNVPNLPRDLVKTLPEVGVEDPLNRGISKTFPTDPHNTFGSAKSVRHPPPFLRYNPECISVPECNATKCGKVRGVNIYAKRCLDPSRNRKSVFQGTSQDTKDTTRTLNGSSKPAYHLPVGLVNRQNPPVQNCSKRESTAAAAHDPVPETSLSAACEERKRHDIQENGAGFYFRSEEPGNTDDSLIKSEEQSDSGVSLEEADQTFKELEEKKDPNCEQDDEGRSRESASSGGSESGPREVFERLEKGCSAEPEQCDQTFPNFLLSGGGRLEEESGSREETNRSVKDSLSERTCYTAESGNAQSSDVYEGGSLHIRQVQTAEPTGKLTKEISAECGAAGAPANPASPRSFHLAVPESHTPFFFPHTRSRPPTAPTMPTLPEEEEDSPEEVDSASSSPSSAMPLESKLVNVTLSPPAIVLPRQDNKQEPRPLEKARPHSPRPRLSRHTSLSGPITTVDNDGHVIDLVKDELPEMQLSEEDRQKNLELLEEAKKVSDRFLTRRGRRSTCSLSDSPTALSPNPTPGSSPVPSRSSSVSSPPQTGTDPTNYHKLTLKKLVEWKPPEKRKVSSGTLTPRQTSSATAKELTTSSKDVTESCIPTDRGKKLTPVPVVQKPDSQTPATGVAKPVPRPAMQQAPCTAEIKTIGAFPPLMRAVSWDTVGSLNMRNGGPKEEDGLSYPDNLKPPVITQKLSKLRGENKLSRNQSISGSKLPDLNESAEQDQDPSSSTKESTADEELKEKADAMPNISDVMLRKLKLHRGLAGCAPPLTEKEVELTNDARCILSLQNAFVQLSLAFRNDNYTLETRLKQAERERNLTEENTEKELEEFKNSLKSTVSLWQNAEQREFYQRLIETVAVLHRLTNRLSSRAEMVGAVRQEKRMNKATEVMLQYVENLKRTYEKDHAELMEFKKLANQNLNRYGGSIESRDDGVPHAARPLTLTMGKCEANSMKSDSSSDSAQQTAGDNGKVLLEQEGEAATPTKASCSPEEIRAEIKAKIEEEAYKKGYQEGLKKLKELQEVKEEEEKAEEKEMELEEITGEELGEENKPSRFERVLEVFERTCPKIFRRNRTLWIVLTLFFVAFLLVNIINFLSSLYIDHADAATEKSNVPGKKKFLGLRVGSKSPSPE
ncbi:hypothetical protein QTP70_024318, partial [Hemibagrus guttatus]